MRSTCTGLINLVLYDALRLTWSQQLKEVIEGLERWHYARVTRALRKNLIAQHEKVHDDMATDLEKHERMRAKYAGSSESEGEEGLSTQSKRYRVELPRRQTKPGGNRIGSIDELDVLGIANGEKVGLMNEVSTLT